MVVVTAEEEEDEVVERVLVVGAEVMAKGDDEGKQLAHLAEIS